MRAEISPMRLRYFRRTLSRWFSENARDLPWRKTNDPYRIMVSEILLQQTQVKRVIEVYDDFLIEFPTIETVAAARLEDVRRITDPLGYKIRGSWIKQIADDAVNERKGRLPNTVEGLLALPGIGRYTAGAIMTFAYQVPTPILDTNISRVLGRWFARDLPQQDSPSLRNQRLWALSESLLPKGKRYGKTGWTINQALMDFGALQCKARLPSCDGCQFRRRCHYVQIGCHSVERGIVKWLPSQR